MSRRVGLRTVQTVGGRKIVELSLSPPSKDTYINESLPAVNYGDFEMLRIRKETPDLNYRILLEFNISSIPANANILSATLKLWAYYQLGYPMTQVVNRIIGAWTEMGVNWGNQPTVTETNKLTIEISATINEWKDYDVTEMTKDARAVGTTVGFRMKHLVEGGEEQRMSFHSKEWPNGNPAVLEVVYS